MVRFTPSFLSIGKCLIFLYFQTRLCNARRIGNRQFLFVRNRTFAFNGKVFYSKSSNKSEKRMYPIKSRSISANRFARFSFIDLLYKVSL